MFGPLTKPTMDFLTDASPAAWDPRKLAARAKVVISLQATATPHQWYTAANGLGLALVISGERQAAATLMKLAIHSANQGARRNADFIEYGVEAWINLTQIHTSTATDVEGHLRAAYDLTCGRPVDTAHLFSLEVARLSCAAPSVRKRVLSLLRNRSQMGLLRLYLGRSEVVEALSFARQVTRDYPRAVQLGMLQSAEVLARYEPDDTFLRRFSVETPASEGDFVVALWFLESRPSRVGRDIREIDRFNDLLKHFSSTFEFRNPRTVAWWRLVHSYLVCDHAAVEANAAEAAKQCVEAGDRRLFDSIRRLVPEVPAHLYVTPPTPAPSELLDLMADLTACFDLNGLMPSYQSSTGNAK